MNIPEGKNKEYRLLAIGTLSSKITAEQGKSPNLGLLDWGEDLISLMMASQESVTNYVLTQKLGDTRYLRIDEIMSENQNRNISLDIATPSATETLCGLGKTSAQNASGKTFMKNILSYTAPKPRFYN